ncbi:MAG: RNA polymerase sigma factor [Sedimentisphaerales bacterium]|nr:RNA polymerase sigma factor [Sedimentisphaerales bacterium]
MVLANATLCENNTYTANAAGILEEHAGFIRTVIGFHVKDKNLADDIFQDFFLSLNTKPIPLGVTNVRGYLYRAITNDIIDASRRAKRYQARIHRYAKHIELKTTKNGSEVHISKTEEIEKIFRTIKKHVSRSEAQAIELRHVNGYNIMETARKMGVKKRSVSRYLSVGLNKIRRVLVTEGGNRND